jgi:DNA-binding transcriptional LysR family regulator
MRVDQLDAMRVFVAVADGGSLSSAARRLGLPLASVSRRVAALEAHLGARLLSRTTRRMALTEAGRRYVERCRRLLGEVEEADHEAAGEQEEIGGPLAVTAPIVFGRLHVLPVAAEFLRCHPRADLRLLLADRMVELIDEGIDVAVRVGALPDSSLVALRVGSIRRIACASPAYLAARGVPLKPEDLSAHDCITFSVLSSSERWTFPARKGARSVPVRSRLVVTTAEAAVDAALAGLGVTRVLSYQAAEAIAAGRLRRILERFEPPPSPVSVLHGDGRAPRRKVREFVALAAARLRPALRA